MILYFNRFDYYEEKDYYSGSMDDIKKNLADLHDKISLLEDKVERMKSFNESLSESSELSDLDFFNVAKEFYRIHWNTTSHGNYSLRKDDDLRHFVEILMDVNADELDTWPRSDINLPVSYNNYTEYEFSNKKYILYYVFNQQYYEIYVPSNKVPLAGSEEYLRDFIYFNKVITVRSCDIPIVYRNVGEKSVNFNLSSEFVQKQIMAGKILVLSFPSNIPFPIEYAIVQDLDVNSLDCICNWLTRESSTPEYKLNGYQRGVLRALKSYLIPLIKNKIIKEIPGNIQRELNILEMLKSEYNNLLRNYRCRLESEAKRLDFK